MFGSLIRRKQTNLSLGEDNIAFESTTFSLTTAVPRPSERRSDERLIAMLRVAKLTDAGISCETTNGRISVSVPRDARAQISARVTNGAITTSDLQLAVASGLRTHRAGQRRGGQGEERTPAKSG